MQTIGSVMQFVYLVMQLAVLVLIVYIYWNRNQGVWTFSFEYLNTPFGDIRTGAQYNPVSSSTCSMGSGRNFITSGSGIINHVNRMLGLNVE